MDYKRIQQNHPRTTNSDNVTECLQLLSTDISGPVTPTATEGSRHMAKFTDDFGRLKVVYFIKSKDEALTTLRKFVEDLAIPRRLRVQRSRTDHEGYFPQY